MTSDEPCDLLVVGGGPAGHEAALTGANLGLSVTLVERQHLGGTCLNWGCIPTKLFLGATEAIEELEAQARQKLAEGRVTVSLPALQVKKERLVAASRAAVAASLQKAGARRLEGEVTGLSPGLARLSLAGAPSRETTLPFRQAILATGSRPAAYPGLCPDGGALLDSNAALALSEVPPSLLVIGAGAIGLELAQFFRRLGSKVTLVEAADRVAPTEDPDVSRILSQALARKGMVIRTGVRPADLASVDGRARLTLATGEDIVADKALLAVGRFPNSDIAGLSAMGARFLGKTPQTGWIETDEYLQAAPNVFAVGDVNGRTLLAHAAAHQAAYAARRAAGLEKKPYDPGHVPGCVYGSPEVMRVGLMVRDAKAMGQDVTVSESALAANPMAQAHAATAGFVRVVWSEGRVAGVTAVGHGVSTMSTLAAVLVGAGYGRKELRDVIFAHPGLDESLKAALFAPAKRV